MFINFIVVKEDVWVNGHYIYRKVSTINTKCSKAIAIDASPFFYTWERFWYLSLI